MIPDNVIHRLSLIGYWSNPCGAAERSRGWPDPRELTGAWNTEDRRATLAHLRRGKVFRTFLGLSSCRICACSLGSQELSDGIWAWPEGLPHYVEMHDIRLPEAFVAASRSSEAGIPSWLASIDAELWLESNGSATPMAPTAERTWIVDDCTWLDWTAANTPARPGGDACSLDEARKLSRGLSHLTWSCEIDDAMGRWLLKIQDDKDAERIYVQKCSATILERCLLSLRVPDSSRILDLERAASIAAEYDGAWGAARAVAAHPQAWLVWVRRPEGDWPTEDQIDEILGEEQRFGWATTHLRGGGGKSYIVPHCDEPAWRWVLTGEREAGEERLKHEPMGDYAQRPGHVKKQKQGLAGLWSSIRRVFSPR